MIKKIERIIVNYSIYTVSLQRGLWISWDNLKLQIFVDCPFNLKPSQAYDHWFWIPWVLPHLGGVLGALIYTFLIELHHPTEVPVLNKS